MTQTTVSDTVLEKRFKRGRHFEKAPRSGQTDEIEVLRKLFEIVKEYREEPQQTDFVEYRTPDELNQLLNLDQNEGQTSWEQMFKWVEQYLKYSVRTNHPRFLNRMWSGANLPSIVGEVIAAISNTSAGTFESAPVSTLMEKYMIQRMLDLVDFPDGEGQMTTGSSNANLIAMLTARNRVNSNIKQDGLFSGKELYAFVSQDAHYSLDKAANILGIGTKHLIKIPVNKRGQMDIQALEEKLSDVENQGGVPFFVCATAGTTVRGAYDPIKGLLKLKKKHDFWLHVDGAWGGAAIFSNKLRNQYIKGIEEVDSFTWDFHKMAGTALICNVLLVKNGDALKESVQVGDTSYIYGKDTDDDDFNLGSLSLQCGRRADSLKWFLDWNYYGQQGLASRIESYLKLCEYSEKRINQYPELEMVVPRESFNVCFRFVVPVGISSNEFNENLRNQLHRLQIGLIGSGYIGDEYCLRLLIANPEIDQKALELFFQDLVSEGNKLLGQTWTS